MDKKPENDVVNHPAHYCRGGLECIDVIKAALTPEEFRGYLHGNMIKYSFRLDGKGAPSVDARKACWYGERLAAEIDGKPGAAPAAVVPEVVPPASGQAPSQGRFCAKCGRPLDGRNAMNVTYADGTVKSYCPEHLPDDIRGYLGKGDVK